MKWNGAVVLALAMTTLQIVSPDSVRAAKATIAPPDLRGQWRLDPVRSDDVQKKLQEAMADARPGPMGGDGMGMGGGPGGPGGGMPPGGGRGGGAGGRGGGMPPGGGGWGGGPGGGDMPDGDMPGRAGDDGGSFGTRLPRGSRTLESFTLEQAGDTLAFVDHGLRVRLVIVNDGHALPAVTADGVEQASARWKKSRLIVESRGPRGGKNTETWELLNDGQTLRCLGVMRLPGAMGSIEINRIYARAALTRPGNDPSGEGRLQ